jgi:hypothetical protein
MKRKNRSYYHGFSAVLATIILAAILIIGAVVYYLATSLRPPIGNPFIKNELGDLSVLAPEFDLSASPLPKLNASALNISTPDLPTSFFSGMLLDTKINTLSANTAIKMPSINFSYAPLAQPQAPQIPPASNPGTQPPSGGQPATNCASFSSVPSCSYVGVSGSDAYNACKACYPNK